MNQQENAIMIMCILTESEKKIGNGSVTTSNGHSNGHANGHAAAAGRNGSVRNGRAKKED